MADEFPYALFVEGKWDPKTPKLKNKLTIYFQSKKSNGGDCCVELLEAQKATVSFKTEEVRRNVLEKQTHEAKIGQNLVSLIVYLSPEAAQEPQSPAKADQTAVSSQEELPGKDEEPPEADPQTEEAKKPEPAEESEVLGRRSAVLENIQNMSQEFLVMLVENILKLEEPESKFFEIEVIPESNCAVIMFMNRKDAENFILSCPDNSVFRKKKMDVKPLEKTPKVKAEDLPSSVNCDYITLFFEKYGEVEGEVEMLEDGQSAIITFKDHKVVNKVLSAQHQIKHHPIKVFPYYESLGTALYGKDRPTLRLPEAFTEKIDKSVWKYLQDNPGSLDLIKQEMRKHFCQLDLHDAAVKISPLASLLHQGLQTRKLIQTWRENASAEFTAAMSKYKSLEIIVQRDAWNETEAEIQKTRLTEPVTMDLQKDQGTVILAGLAEDVSRTGDVVQNIVNRITQMIQREKGSVTDEIAMDPSTYEIVMLGGLEPEISNSFPEMGLSYHSHSKKLALYGLKQEVLESKNKILQEVIGLKRRMVELHPSILEYLSRREQQELTSDLFLSKGIRASLEIKENQALLVAKTEKTLKDSEERLKAMLNHKCLDIEDPSVLRKVEWQDLITSLNNSFNSLVMTVVINTSGSQVMVAGFDDVVELVLEQLSDFVQNNSNLVATIEADNIVVKFIQEHRKQDWVENVKNKVSVDFKDGKILLSGPRVHVSQCKPVFQNLVSSVHHCNLKVAKPGAKKFYKMKESMYVTAAKDQTGCLVELVDEHEVFQAGAVSVGKQGVLTPEGVEIVVSKGNMCFYPVDAVVNATNEKLDFNGGLSKALSDAAGPQLQDACRQILKTRKQLAIGDAVLTSAGGQLRCKFVIHAVGPHYDSSNRQRAVGLLKKAVKRSLNLADRESCQSMAIPAISSGNLGFPLDLCADTIVGALKEFLEFVSGDCCLKKIHLVDNNDKTVEALEAAVQKVYGGSSASKDKGTVSKVKPSQPQQNITLPSSSSQSSSQSVKTNEGLTVTLSKCNIQDTTEDVVVNSIFPDLSLNHGAISKAIFTAAGPQLQVVLNQQATGKANVGAVFVTTACNLKNKLVFHAVSPHWNQGQGSEQKELEGIVDKCLGEAEQQQQKSIVFPAIGTGNLGFPKTLVASLMLDSVLKFSKKRSSKHVQEVVFALNPIDTQTIQAFTDEFNKKFNIQPSSSSAFTQQQSNGPFSSITSKSGSHETTVGGVVLKVLTGDITKEKVDVIVNSSNDDFTLKAGVSKAILDAAGPNVEAECQQLGAQQNSGLIMTQPGNLQCKKIIHISPKNDPAAIQKRVTKALQMCAKQNFTSISFPAFGTGQGGVNAGQVADAMLDAVVDFVTQTPQSSIKLIHIVIFQAPLLTNFHQSMQRREGSDKQKKQSALSKIAAYAKSWIIGWKDKDDQQRKGKGFVIEGKVVHPACFSICGPSKAAVDHAKQWIEKLISDEQAFELISDLVILSLSDKDQQRIQELEKSMDVSVRVEHKVQDEDQEEATVLVEGLSRDVLMAVSEIQTILKKARDEVGLKKDMKVISELVDWQYQQGGQYQSFDQLTNLNLEQALAKKSSHVDISLHGQAYKVTMPEGPAVCAVGGNQINIRRIDKTQVIADDSLPQEWDIMAATELFKEFPLQANSNEYKDVLSHFRKTCPNNNVLKISRIQNPGMWKKYQHNKHIMEIKNGHKNNERRLFHGTREDSMKHINHSGFNRSYAGMNAAAYGKGTYFALNASYSASNTYSVPNQQGHKHMYLCRVLTGDYTPGNSSMVVPPPKSANGIDLYDTVVDNTRTPTIFVVFRDDHAYPEYLITFT
ncbi:poly(ADP-ribose) polymerase family member 14-related sequence 1 isoform X2 [Colossoma macropomum]|uniref:poly(ADP-ribose) polymerase family member 14-related sequence 1 isoform X2 n=1 Tax=Colossoma macropomum TaxID=42526 RepID=UPI001864BC04|nr:poly(ADP-ribose) polymerase family member 14-related sequence 1 isoform X2 [Colossoma macropomum]